MAGLWLLAAVLGPAANPAVHVMIHVPLAHAPLRDYRRDLARHGTLTDHFGVGTWTNSGDPAAAIVAEGVDHLEVATTLAAARAFVPPFLHRLRIRQHQRETLAEIFGGSFGTAAQMRERICVTLTLAQAAGPRVRRLHRIFANRGDGGDSEYADLRGVHLYSGVRPSDAPRIEAQLRHDGFAFVREQETFITDDAPSR